MGTSDNIKKMWFMTTLRLSTLFFWVSI